MFLLIFTNFLIIYKLYLHGLLKNAFFERVKQEYNEPVLLGLAESGGVRWCKRWIVVKRQRPGSRGIYLGKIKEQDLDTTCKKILLSDVTFPR
jgi:hypothetical protein